MQFSQFSFWIGVGAANVGVGISAIVLNNPCFGIGHLVGGALILSLNVAYYEIKSIYDSE